MPVDYKLYPEDWKTRIRPDILERAHHHCEFCGVANYWPHPETGSRVVLTIAHLDQDITHNDYKNLAALCQCCHNRHDAPFRALHRYQNRLKKLKQRGQLRIF